MLIFLNKELANSTKKTKTNLLFLDSRNMTFEQKSAAVVTELNKQRYLSARMLRKRLGLNHNIIISRVDFFLLMSKLESKGIVYSWDKQRIIAGCKVKARCYKLVDYGIK